MYLRRLNRTKKTSEAFDFICEILVKYFNVLPENAAPDTELAEKLSEHAIVASARKVKGEVNKTRRYVLDRYYDNWHKDVEAAVEKIEEELKTMKKISKQLIRPEQKALFNNRLLKAVQTCCDNIKKARDIIDKAIGDLQDLGDDLQ